MLLKKNRFYRVEIDDVVWGMLSYYFEPLKHEPFVAEVLQGLSPLRLVNAYRTREFEQHEKLAPFETNFLEDWYSVLEGKFDYTIKKLSAAPRNMRAIVKDDFKIHHDNLLVLFASQYFRTRKARQNIVDLTKDMYLESQAGTQKLSALQVDTVTKVILFVNSVLLAENLIRTGFSIGLAYNASSRDLITTSTPTSGHVQKRERLDDIVSFKGYMPLAPKINMYLSKAPTSKGIFQFNNISREVVSRQNKMLAEFSDLDVYATTERQLKAL